MLENLDKIDWAALSHAYGSARDVPDLLRQLTSSDEKVLDKTYSHLYSNICHQGTVYQASSYAVPFLIELLQEPSVEEKESILGLLDSIAQGNSYVAVHLVFEELSARNDEQYQQEMQIELHWVRQAYLAVREGLQVYYLMLNHSDPKIRSRAARLISTFQEESQAKVSSSRLYDRFKREEEVSVKNSLIWALGYVARFDTPQSELLYSLVLNSSERIYLRQLAASSLAQVAVINTPDVALKILIEEIIQQSIALPSDHEQKSIGIESACEGLCFSGTERGLPALTQALANVGNSEAALIVTEYLLNLAFAENKHEVMYQGQGYNSDDYLEQEFGLTPETQKAILRGLETWQDKIKNSLSSLQKQAISAIVSQDKLWDKVDTNLYNIYELPAKRADLASLLA